MASDLKIGYLEARLVETQSLDEQYVLVMDENVKWFLFEPIAGSLYSELHHSEIFGSTPCNVLVDGEPTTSKTTVLVNETVTNRLQNVIKTYAQHLRSVELQVPLSDEVKVILRTLAILTKALDCCSLQPESVVRGRISLTFWFKWYRESYREQSQEDNVFKLWFASFVCDWVIGKKEVLVLTADF